MRPGLLSSIPEHPRDLDDLRRRGRPIDDRSRPRWLAAADRGEYLYLGSTVVDAVEPTARWRLDAEIEAMHVAGLVVTADPGRSGLWHVYIPARADQPTWSIGIYGGATLAELGPARGADNPVLTRDHVSDVEASFVADPFMLPVEREWHLFFELFNWRANKGEIGLATSDDGLAWRYRGRVLVEPFHLSYPQVFRVGSEVYLAPETRQSGALRLYRARAFPFEWELETMLLEGEDLFDATLFERGGRWWMLAGADGRRKSDTLRLFLATALAGPWREHPRSPVVRDDPRHARPAGRVVLDGARVIRWAQRCEPVYGLEVRGFEITALDPQAYDERPLQRSPNLGPTGSGWAARGMHHVDAHRLLDGQWLACVDGQTEAPA